METVILYDSACALCTQSVRIVKVLDWLGRIELRDARAKSSFAGLPKIDRSDAVKQVYAVTGTRVRTGFFAFRRIAWQVPAFWILAPFLYLPGAGTIGDALYHFISSNRFRLYPKCTSRACKIHYGKG